MGFLIATGVSFVGIYTKQGMQCLVRISVSDICFNANFTSLDTTIFKKNLQPHIDILHGSSNLFNPFNICNDAE